MMVVVCADVDVPGVRAEAELEEPKGFVPGV
jgi:hypothetical protein